MPSVNETSYTYNMHRQNHRSTAPEKNDFYATEPRAVYEILELEEFSQSILEPCVGEGHIAKVLEEKGHKVIASDIVDYGYPNTLIKDFRSIKENKIDIITNPPYKLATEFIKHFVDISDSGVKIALFLKLTFLEGIERGNFFKENPPKTVYVYSSRRNCARNGDFDKYKSSAVAYAWFVWEVGYKGDSIIKWID